MLFLALFTEKTQKDQIFGSHLLHGQFHFTSLVQPMKLLNRELTPINLQCLLARIQHVAS